jgi:hypothetical protein
LPRRLIEACREQARPFFVIAFDGETDPAAVQDTAHRWLGLGAVGAVLKTLEAEGCAEVTLCGPVKRPEFSRLRLDWQGVKLMGRIMSLAGRGDDALLRAVIGELEAHGFRVIGCETVLAPLLAPEGPLGALAPDEAAQRDIALGIKSAAALGREDRGQAVVVRAGAVLGVEDARGTDALLANIAPAQEGRSGVLVKIMKPQQDSRADLPAIGPRTVRGAARAGLAGIAVETERTFIIERAQVAQLANENGLFVVGVRVQEGEGR